MNKKTINQTYKNLRTLVYLFIAGVVFLIALNYVFMGFMDNLDKKTKDLYKKNSIEKKLTEDIIIMSDKFSKALLAKDENSFLEYQNDIKIKSKEAFELIQVLHYREMTDLKHIQNLKSIFLDFEQKMIDLKYIVAQRFQNTQRENTDSFLVQHQEVAFEISTINKILKKLIKSSNILKNNTMFIIQKTENEIQRKKEIYFNIEIFVAGFILLLIIYFSNTIRKQILKTNEELENSSRQASKMAIRAKQANKAKSEFFANMSHEIRTPLNAVLGFIDILREQEKNEEKLKYLQIIHSSSTTLLDIINDILDFSKIESGGFKIEKIDFKVRDEFYTLVELFKARASQKNINLSLDIDKLVPLVLHSDPLKLKQVTANLVSNAIKFTPRNGRIELKINHKDEKLNISVKDNGIGIPKEKQKNIFKAFYQAEASTTRQYGGTGLGLAISSKLVKMLDGELMLKSYEDNGSIFYFSVPVKIGKNVQTINTLDVENFDLHDKKILLVEDNKANQMFMSLVLKKLNLSFKIASDGQEAVNMFESENFDLILMDENMPNLNGIEATKKILEIEKKMNLIHTPIIALTANALNGDREKFINSGMDEYLTKPIQKNRLAKVLKVFLSKEEYA